MTEPLKPCPFCGGKAERSCIAKKKIPTGFYMQIYCTECDAKVSASAQDASDVVNKAIAAWNTRAERTCRNLGGEEGTNYELYDFGCSSCGYCADITEPNYCPYCRAKVVD